MKLVIPVPRGSIVTQTFAEHEETRRVKNLKYYNGGIDWAVPTGTIINAAAKGKVIRADEDKTGYGIHVRIDHGNGWMTLYGHLLTPLVGVGDIIPEGASIGRSDNSGNSTGPHLHFELRINGVPKDPQEFLADNLPATPSIVSPTVGEGDFTYVVDTPVLYERSGPGTAFARVGQLAQGQEIHPTEIWARDKQGFWVALYYDGVKLAKEK